MTPEVARLAALLKTVSDAAEFSLDRHDYDWGSGGTATHWMVYAESYGDWHNRTLDRVRDDAEPLIEYRESMVFPRTEWEGEIHIDAWAKATGLTPVDLADAIKAAKESESGVPVMMDWSTS